MLARLAPEELPSGAVVESEYDPLFGQHVTISFPNGYAASVILGPSSYGVELAVLKGDDLCYTTPITGNVVGHISDLEELQGLILEISKLPLDTPELLP